MLIAQQPTTLMRRSMSYNDLKKRRMMRTNTNRKLVHINKQNAKEKQHEENSHTNLPICNQKLAKTNEKENYLTKLMNVVKQIQNKNQNNLMNAQQKIEKQFCNTKVCEIEKFYDNNEGFQQMKNQELKKIKSLRILTKKSHKSFNVTTKLNTDTLRRINLNIGQNCQNQEFAKKYKTVPQTLAIKNQQTVNYRSKLQTVKTKQRRNQNQNIFFNAISPIQQKSRKSFATPISQISGFSMLLDIEQSNKFIKQNEFEQISILMNKKSKNSRVSTQDIKHIGQVQLKMPKIMKKHLPKDFFLRV